MEKLIQNNSVKFCEIRQRIKAFTKREPSDESLVDPSYKIYLAKCAKLYELDNELTDSVNLDLEPEELNKMLHKIESLVDEILPK